MSVIDKIHTDERAILAMVLAMVPVIPLTSLFVGATWLLDLGVAAGIAAFAIVAAVAGLSGRKPLIGVALIGQCVVLTATFSGHPWQIDSHMVFFAALAVLVILRDIPTIIAATAAIAIHHLSLSYFMPALVYPSVDLVQNLIRTGLHAVVFLIEAGILWRR